MKIITVGFSTSKRWNPLSALIKWWWSTDYSHVYIRWDTPWGFEEILESSGTRVGMVNEVVWAKKNRVINEFKFLITKEEFNLMMTLLRPLCGIPYGWKQLIGLMVRELFRLKKNPFHDKNGTIICCEVAYLFLTKVLSYKIPIAQDDIVPKDIYRLIKGNR